MHIKIKKYINQKVIRWSMRNKKRRTSAFEKLLLIVGLAVLVVGYFMVNKVFQAEGYKLSWGFLQTVFLWLLMVIFIILLAIGEDIKEGILLEQTEQLKEIKSALKKKS